ncbi:MAG: hypothetical protein PHS82_06270 [Lachnospiraceae bacterium]|nr:hypothetical protein [Lachnospiraceae bacterium]
MRLIDADAEKEKRMAEIRKCEERIAEYKGLDEPDNAKINHRIEMQRANISDLKMEIHILEECSTAYDIGEVVEQLGEAPEDAGFTPEQIRELVKKYSWHKVADGDLPTHSNRVLVYIKYKASHRIPPHRVANYAGEKWWYPSDREITGEAQVIAWMELPEYEVPMIDCKINTPDVTPEKPKQSRNQVDDSLEELNDEW